MRYKILGLLFVGAISGAISCRAEMTVLMATQLTESEMPTLGTGYVAKKFSHVDLNLGFDASTKKFTLGLRTADGVQLPALRRCSEIFASLFEEPKGGKGTTLVVIGCGGSAAEYP